MGILSLRNTTPDRCNVGKIRYLTWSDPVPGRFRRFRVGSGFRFPEYKIPTMLDMPQVKTIIVESNEPNGPFGAKEVGEGAIMPTIPAILNAVYDAIGVRIHELPLTPERVYLAIQEAKKGKTA